MRLLGPLILAVASLLFAPSALAARGHVESNQLIGNPCTALLEPCGSGLLKEPSGLAVNEASGDIYVADKGNARVQVFDPSGAFLFMFGGGVDKTQVEEREAQEAASEPVTVTAAEENLCTASSGDDCQPGSAGSGEGQIETPEGIAVDNACVLQNPPLTGSACESFDPSNGDVYVVDAGQRVVDKYSSDGAYLGQITEAGGQSFSVELLDGVAVDPMGGVWIYQEIRSIDHFSNANPNVFLPPKIHPENFGSGIGHQGFAADSSGAFYIKSGFGEEGPGPISKVNHAGEIVTAELDGDESSTVAVEQTSDVAFVDSATSLAAFSPDGTELERFDFNGGLIEATGIGVDAASGFAYVADAAAGHLLVLAPRPPGPPRIEGGLSVSAVTSESAELHGEVSPQSEPNESPTTYRFEYGPCASPTACATSPFGFSTPPGSLQPDFGTHPIGAPISGLQPGTTYHFRILATNDLGATTGEEGIFSTQAAGLFALPDSRQWELVSPANKLGAPIQSLAETGVIEAAADGSAMTYLALTPTEAEPAGYNNKDQVLSRREPAGWSSHDLGVPHLEPSGFNGGSEHMTFDSGLDHAVVQPFGQFNPGLSAEASESTAFLRDLSPSCSSSCFRPLVTGAPGFANVPPGTQFGEEQRCTPNGQGTAIETVCGPAFVGATEDLRHVVIRSRVGLTANPGERPGLYEWSDGALSELSILPDGDQPSGTADALGLEGSAARGAISADGSRVVWEDRNGTKRLYLRYNATEPQSAVVAGRCSEPTRACTLQLDAPEPGCLEAGECEAGGDGEFQIASADGSRIFFTDHLRLTADSGATPTEGSHEGSSDLYECRIFTAVTGRLECALTDATPRSGEERADVQGGVLGASADGSSVYLVADGVLAANVVDNGAGPESAQAGKPNLYLVRDGVTAFLTTLAVGDKHDWADGNKVKWGLLSGQPTRVTANGRWLELMSARSLTGYDNRDTATGQPVAEVYLFDAAHGRLVCASCDPTGARPHGVEYEELSSTQGGLVGGDGLWTDTLVAANVPGWTAAPADVSHYQDRYLSDSGRLFFDANDGLVPQDSNGTEDVYQYEPLGVGSCGEGSPTFQAKAAGCVGLISAGTSGGESAFLDASESGDDVFFLTRSQLSPQDVDAALDVYDAHACPPGAAIPCLPEASLPATACSGEACQPASVPPAEGGPGSASFNGGGNVVNCRKGQVKKAGKCVRKGSKKHHRKKRHHAKKGKKRTANDHRRVGR